MLAVLMVSHALAGTGDVYVKANVVGARVLVDGEDTGLKTPVMLEGIEEGAHEVQVLDDQACQRAVQDVVVRPGAIERAELEVRPSGGFLTVTSQPVGAQVAIDGGVVGVTPLERQPLDCGTHTVEVSLDEYVLVERSVEVRLAEEIPVGLLLEEADTGTLVVGVTPLEAEIRLDDRPVGVGPLTLDAVDTGQHVVSARLKGYGEAAQTVSVVSQDSVRVDLTLERLPSLSERTGLNRVHWSTVGLGTGLAAGSLTLGILGRRSYLRAEENYAVYTGLAYSDDPEAFYADGVERPRTQAFVLAGVAGALALGSAASWALLPVLDPEAPSISLSRRF